MTTSKSGTYVDRLRAHFRRGLPQQSTRETFLASVEAMALALGNVARRPGSPAWQQAEDSYARLMHIEGLGDFAAEGLALLSLALADEPRDLLGELYMDLGGDKDRGQFFTPLSVSRLMAAMLGGSTAETIERDGYFSLLEPACGSGGMVIAQMLELREARFDPETQMVAECWDISGIACDMTLVQLSLLGVPAVVVRGDTLTQEVFAVSCTPAYTVGGWAARHGATVEPIRQAMAA